VISIFLNASQLYIYMLNSNNTFNRKERNRIAKVAPHVAEVLATCGATLA